MIQRSGTPSDVLESGPDLSGPTRRHRQPLQLGRAHHGECGEDRRVGYGVNREAPAVADRHDEQAGEGGSRDASHAVHGAVERHGVGHLVGRHHLVDERPPHRVVQRQQSTSCHGDAVERGERCVVHERQRRERERFAHLERLRDVEKVALTCSIDDHTCPGRQQQDRAVLARHQQAKSHPAPGAVQDEEGQSNIGQPVAGLGDGLADEEQAEVPPPEGRQSAPDETGSLGKTVVVHRIRLLRRIHRLVPQPRERLETRPSSQSMRTGAAVHGPTDLYRPGPSGLTQPPERAGHKR